MEPQPFEFRRRVRAPSKVFEPSFGWAKPMGKVTRRIFGERVSGTSARPPSRSL